MSVLEGRAFSGTLDGAVEAEAWSAAEAERLGLDADEAFAMTLCLEELFVNAVRHGYARQVRIAVTRDSLEFRDDGEAFDPSRATPKRIEAPGLDFEIGGFGTGLLQTFADRLSWRREGGWNVVTLAFRKGAR